MDIPLDLDLTKRLLLECIKDCNRQEEAYKKQSWTIQEIKMELMEQYAALSIDDDPNLGETLVDLMPEYQPEVAN